MGAGSSTDKAVGNLINTTTQGVKTVLKDQTSEKQDFFQHPWLMIFPTVIGVICVIVSFVVFFSTSKCKPDPNDPKTEVCHSGDLKTFGILLSVGILLIIVVQIVLAVRHPRAAAEMAVGYELEDFFKSV